MPHTTPHRPADVTLTLTRSSKGVLTLRFYTDGGPAAFSGSMQR